jgi:hypothetical protein
MSDEDLVEAGYHIPPFHPNCRTICVGVQSDDDATDQQDLQSVAAPEDQPYPDEQVTQDTFAEAGIDISPEEVAAWNSDMGINPLNVLADMMDTSVGDLTDMKLQDAVSVDDDGMINMLVDGPIKGAEADGKFTAGQIFDPYTGTLYLSEAEFVAGDPEATA